MTDIIDQCGGCDGTTTNEDAARTFYVPSTMKQPHQEFELVPAPLLNVSMQHFYANESIIGYTYNVTLTGYASSKQNRQSNNGATIDWVVNSIAKVQNIFDGAGNGGNLIIMSPHFEKGPLMIFKGGRIKSQNYAPNDNQWVNYSEYTIELEFNDVEFFGCDTEHVKGCGVVFHDGTSKKDSEGNVIGVDTVQEQLVDIKKFKIKNFNDQWNINLGDEVYDHGKVGGSLDVNNKRYNVQYTISATGQHHWDDAGNLFPAWKHAKAFCQDRLVKQINGLYQNLAMHYMGPELEPCESHENLKTIHSIDQPSIHNTIGAMNIFDETISFNHSESDGTFSVTYNSVVKKGKETCITSADTNHDIRINYAGSNTCGQNKTAKSVNLSGTIQGLLRNNQGSIFYPNSLGFTLPEGPGQISFIGEREDSKHKWDRAKDLLDRFIDECDGKIICGELCDIVLKCLTPPDNDECKELCAPSCPRPSNFSITHNYNTGTIDYNLDFSYDSNDIDQNRCNITISTEEPVPLTAEFTIPGRGIYYQPLGGCTPKKWTVNAEGRVSGYDDISCQDLAALTSVCGCLPKGCVDLLPEPGANYLLLSKQQTFNPIDGSFSYNATYACTICDAYVGCGTC